jgi:hypothetical protein
MKGNFLSLAVSTFFVFENLLSSDSLENIDGDNALLADEIADSVLESLNKEDWSFFHGNLNLSSNEIDRFKELSLQKRRSIRLELRKVVSKKIKDAIDNAKDASGDKSLPTLISQSQGWFSWFIHQRGSLDNVDAKDAGMILAEKIEVLPGIEGYIFARKDF